METNKEYPLPFITRKMLNFEYASRFELVINTHSTGIESIWVTGATKEGAFTYKIVTTANEGGDTYRLNIPDFPIWVSVIDIDKAIKLGDSYVSISLAINSSTIQTLCAGYVYNNKSISWPYSLIEEQVPTKGSIDCTVSADPAAGAELTYTMEGDKYWKIQAITFTFTTSATVANRRVHLLFNIKQLGTFDVLCSIDQPASTTRKYSCYPAGAYAIFSDDNDITIPIPTDMILPPESKITTETTNLQVGDNFGTMTIFREQFLGPVN